MPANLSKFITTKPEDTRTLSEAIKIDAVNDMVEIYGVKYAGGFFRGFAFGIPENKYFQISERKDGCLVIHETYLENEFIGHYDADTI